MPLVPFSDLNPANPLTGTEIIPVVQGAGAGSNKKVTVDELAAFINGALGGNVRFKPVPGIGMELQLFDTVTGMWRSITFSDGNLVYGDPENE